MAGQPPLDERGSSFASAVETRLGRVWQDALGMVEVRPEDSFAELGDSLSTVLCLIDIRREFGVDLPVEALSAEGTTLRDVARTIAELTMASSAEIRR